MQFFPAAMKAQEAPACPVALSASPERPSSFFAVLTAHEDSGDQIKSGTSSRQLGSKTTARPQDKTPPDATGEETLSPELAGIAMLLEERPQAHPSPTSSTRKIGQKTAHGEKFATSRYWRHGLSLAQPDSEAGIFTQQSKKNTTPAQQPLVNPTPSPNSANTKQQAAVQIKSRDVPATARDAQSGQHLSMQQEKSVKHSSSPVHFPEQTRARSKDVSTRQSPVESHSWATPEQRDLENLRPTTSRTTPTWAPAQEGATRTGQDKKVAATQEKAASNLQEGKTKTPAPEQRDLENVRPTTSRTTPTWAPAQERVTRTDQDKRVAATQEKAAPGLQDAKVKASTPNQVGPADNIPDPGQKASPGASATKQDRTTAEQASSGQSKYPSSPEVQHDADLGPSSKPQDLLVEAKLTNPEAQVLTAPKLSEAGPARGAEPTLPRNAAVYRQVADGAFSTLSQGRKQLTIRLDPPELGQVSVILQVQGKDLRATFRASNPEAAQALGDQLGPLRQQLENQGFRVGRLEVQQQFPESQADSHGQSTQQHNGYQAQREANSSRQHLRALHEIGENLAQDVHKVPHTEKNSSTGLDIFA